MIKKLATLGMAATVGFGGMNVYAANEVTLTFGLQQPVGSLEYRAIAELAETLEKVSGGKMTMDIFPGAQLGDDRAMLSQVSMSELDMTYANFGRFGLWEPEALVVNQPYVVSDFDHLTRILGSEWGQDLQVRLKNHNWLVVDTWYLGTRQTTSNRPINSIEDFKGRKIRVPNAEENLNFVRYSGGAPVPMAFSEVYLALQTNAVDGQENPLPLIQQNKFYEVQDYLAMTNHILNDSTVVMSDSRFSSLTAEQKTWLETALAAGGELHNSEAENAEASLVEYFEKQGMTVTYPDVEPFRIAMAEVYENFERKVRKPGLIEELQAL